MNARRCPDCHGNIKYGMKKCKRCKGKGYIN